MRNDIAPLSSDIEGDRENSVSFKTLIVPGGVGGTVAAVKVAKALKPMIAKIGTKMTTNTVAKGAGKAVANVAGKTGAKVGAKVGGKSLGEIVAVDVIIRDVWNYHRTEKIEKPILREKLADYLAELQHSLLSEPGNGLMTFIHELEANVVACLKHQ